MVEPLSSMSALPKTPGEGFALRSADVTANDVEELEQQGYTLTDRFTEHGTGTGYFVFVFKGEPDANYEDSAALNVVAAEVDEGYSSDSDSEAAGAEYKGPVGEKKLAWRKRKIGSPTGDEAQTLSVPGAELQNVSVEVLFSYAVDRDHPDNPDMMGLCLKMNQCQFEVLNSVDKPDQRGHFVYRIEVSALPTEWKTKVDHVEAYPSSDQTVTFSTQSTVTNSVGVSSNVNGPNIPISVQHSKARGITSSGISAHGWSSAKLNRNARSVMWTWELNYWSDGQKFSPDNLGKVLGNLPTFQHIPDLPFNIESVNLNRTDNEAEWVVPKDQLEGVEEIQWDITVKFYTAMVMKKRWVAIRNRSFGVSWFRVCKEIPPLVHQLTQKLTLQES